MLTTWDGVQTSSSCHAIALIRLRQARGLLVGMGYSPKEEELWLE
jgi:hypothetical protein